MNPIMERMVIDQFERLNKSSYTETGQVRMSNVGIGEDNPLCPLTVIPGEVVYVYSKTDQRILPAIKEDGSFLLVRDGTVSRVAMRTLRVVSLVRRIEVTSGSASNIIPGEIYASYEGFVVMNDGRATTVTLSITKRAKLTVNQNTKVTSRFIPMVGEQS